MRDTSGEPPDLSQLRLVGVKPLKVRQAPIASEWVFATHPETGLAVSFKPGEALPEWAVPKPEQGRKRHPKPVQANGSGIDGIAATGDLQMSSPPIALNLWE